MKKLSPSGVTHFWSELKRRHVVRVGVVYVLVGGGAIQLVTAVFPTLQIGGKLTAAVVILILLGLPLAIGLAWAFDLTPAGGQREEDAAAPPASGRAVPARRIFPAARRPRTTPALPPEPEEREAGPADPVEVRRVALATLRHELRTPLNAVLGYSEMLLEDAEDGAGMEELHALHSAGKRLLAQIDDLLHPAADAVERLSDADLASLRARARDALLAPTAALSRESSATLERARRSGDAEALADLERVAGAAAQLARMVEEMETTAAEMEQPGSGYARMQAEAERVMVRLRPGTGIIGASPRHGRLLVVDDNPLNRDLLSRQLARQGYAVDTADDGHDALERLRTHTYDLVLLDVLMPRMDGIQVLGQMQREPALASIPVIMISALDDMDGVVRCIERGAVDYLAKPFDPVLLRARIGTTLEVHRLREEERRAAESLDMEEAWADRLARSLLPGGVAERMRGGVQQFAELHPELSVVAVELEGFGTLALRFGVDAAVERLAEAVGGVDRVVGGRAVESVWLGADSFVALVGPETPRGEHASLAADLALELAEVLGDWNADAEPLRAGIGLHTGEVAVGLASTERLVLGLWGEGVDLARRLARASATGEVQVSPAAYARLHDRFAFESRGVLQVGDRSQLPVYRLTGGKTGATST
ncbi:MAG TPA: response regulator [Longimicrobiaceae bacterium]|nr:response regulator [Longimicrobiaceae bacterium]